MPTNEVLQAMHRQMVRARVFEETMVKVYMEGKTPAFDIAAGPVPGEMHLAAGQEPVAAGVCAHLRPTDAVTATHRPHHIALAHGMDMKRMAAEIFGKETGLGHGKGGHMHLFDAATNFGCSGIIAEGMPTAVGAALAFKKQGTDDVAVSFFGEGAANQGAFHESLNLAALWDARRWSSSARTTPGRSACPRTRRRAIANNSDRAAAYGIPGVLIPDNDAGRRLRGRRRGGRPGPARRRAVAHRGQDRPPARPLRGRPAGLPDGRGDRARSRSATPSSASRRQLDRHRRHDRRQVAPTVWEAAAAEVDEAIEFARSSPYPGTRVRAGRTSSPDRRSRHGTDSRNQAPADDLEGDLRGASPRRWSATRASS